MTEASRPWTGITTGDAGPYSDTDWQEIWRNAFGWGGQRSNMGVFLGSGTPPDDGLKVQAQSPATASIDVLIGAALVRGVFYINTTTVSFVVGNNTSGNPRIDTVVLRADYIAQTVRLALKQGAPAVTPVPPALTQTPGTLWEIPLADIAVADSFTSIATANITPRQEWLNAPPGVYLDGILNNSGLTLEDGDVVVWDNTADRAVTITTTLDDKLGAGIWRGRAANGAYGRVQVRGIGYVRANAAVTRGANLTSSTTARQAGVPLNGIARKHLARAVETTSGVGLVLCAIDVYSISGYDTILIRDEKATNVAGQTLTITIWNQRNLNTEVLDTGGYASVAANQITLEAGSYEVMAHAAVAGNVTHRLRLQNITDGATILEGANAYSQSTAVIIGSFTISAQKIIQLQHYPSAGVSGGTALNTGASEVYASVYLRRLTESGT